MSTRTEESQRAWKSPRRVLTSLQRWLSLARAAELSYAEVLRYRRELREDREFQEHMRRCLDRVEYVLPQAAELYVLVRAMQPATIVETGVASGISSAHILKALDANGLGVLHSIDLPNVQDGSILPQGLSSGWIVPDSLRQRWDLDIGDARTLLPELLARLGNVDIFMHDSDHSYDHMMFEFELAFPRVREGGLLISDDTHLHRAWDDFCARRGLRAARVGHLGVTRKRRNA